MQELFNFREPVNAGTHGIWMLLCIPSGLILQWKAGRSLLKRAGFAVFTLGLLCCFGGSWLYHTVGPANVPLCMRLDYMGIYLLIAGTTTPVILVVLDRWWRWSSLIAIWGMALTGILIRCLDIPLPDEVSTGLYILMGWTTLVLYCELSRRLSHRELRPIWIGGLIYSIGAILNEVNWPVLWPGVLGSHELFHLFVMTASLCHFAFMLQVLVPYEPAVSELDPEPLPEGLLATERGTA